MQAVHYTNSKINVVRNTASRTQIQTSMRSHKPVGFWYAYDNEWKRHFYRNGAALWKYTIDLRASDFTNDINSPNVHKILKLDSTNFAPFVAIYGKELSFTPKEILNSLIYKRQTQGDETLDFLLGAEGGNNAAEVSGNLIRIKEELQQVAAGEIDVDDMDEEDIVGILELIERGAYEDYDWFAFWGRIQEAYGGVEFSKDLLELKNIPNPDNESQSLDVSWLSRLDIRSGVIFKPSVFLRDRIPVGEEVKAGGGRRTARNLRNRRRGSRRTLRTRI